MHSSKNNEQPTATISVYTADQLLELSEKITLSALKRLYVKTGNEFNRRLYIGLIDDLNNKQTPDYVLSDSYDLVLDLYGYIAQRFFYCELDGVQFYALDLQAVDSDDVSVYKWLYRYLYDAIYQIKVIELKKVYLDEKIDIAIQPDYNIDDYNTYATIKNVLEAMQLTQGQERYIRLRLKGLSLREIAGKMKITHVGIVKYQKLVACKFEKVANKLLDSELLAELKKRYNL